MADVYIIYADEDKNKAELLHGLLFEQWDIWWDKDISGEPFQKTIEREIPKASCVVPLFSNNSREKETVLAELELAHDNKKPIIPVLLDDCRPSYPFNTWGGIVNLHGWEGEINNTEFIQLKDKISKEVSPTKPPKRLLSIPGNDIPLPTFLPSISSHETQLEPAEAVKALRMFKIPAILVSAYDLIGQKGSKREIQQIKILREEINIYREGGGFVLVDSGNYEKYRLNSSLWRHSNFKKALENIPLDWAFCFDVMKPKHDPDRAIEEILEGIERDKCFILEPVLPIIHAPKHNNGDLNLEHIPHIVRKVAERIIPPIIAIPERELGCGIVARAKTVKRIRTELNKMTFYQPLHILGTGNPWSLPILTAAGADTFDGLEWCRMVVDRDKHRLHHFQHFDFFRYQASLADSSITRDVLNDPKISFAGKAVFHNLDYYVEFMNELRESVNENCLEAFVIGKVGEGAAKQLKREIPELYK